MTDTSAELVHQPSITQQSLPRACAPAETSITYTDRLLPFTTKRNEDETKKRPCPSEKNHNAPQQLAKKPKTGTENGVHPQRPQAPSSIDEVIFETTNTIDHHAQGTVGGFAAFFDVNAGVVTSNGRTVRVGAHAPSRYHYSWAAFDDCMKSRLGSNGSTYCCKFTKFGLMDEHATRFIYHFAGPVGFGTIVQLMEAQLTDSAAPASTEGKHMLAPIIRFSTSSVELQGDYVLRVEVPAFPAGSEATGEGSMDVRESGCPV
ncbi:unnamed protein product [Fusarium graminearum]|uniref:Uncharacterized protein n=1 Tax=Gibberella zeae TaxID=5518 RepID=A0A9N8WYC2_GIBZA|nr:unnamed protein product [Fusarium graminearum]